MIKFLGTTDEKTTCDCCGRQGLKRTVVLEIDGNVVFYGTECASNAFGVDTKEYKKIEKIEKQKLENEINRFHHNTQEYAKYKENLNDFEKAKYEHPMHKEWVDTNKRLSMAAKDVTMEQFPNVEFKELLISF